MDNNFNPGFDREKLAFIELANRGGGLDPIEYIYAGDASFESVLASYVKGGMFDINMLYATNIEANDIITVTIEAKIATIDTAYITTIYSDNIYNKDTIESNTILAHDVTVYDDLTVGSVSSLATATFHTSLFEIVGLATSFDILTLSVICGTITSFTTPAFSVNSAAFSVNYFEGALKVGAVGIYSGGLMDINAPAIQIGDPTKLGVKTLTISMKPDLSFTCTSATINLTGTTIINLTSETDINLKSSTIDLAAEFIEVGGITATDYTTIFAIRANKFFVTTQSLASMEILDTGVGTNFSLDGIDVCDIATNSTIINAVTTLTLNAAEINITGITKITGETNVIGAAFNVDSGTINLKSASTVIVDSPTTIVPTPLPLIGEGALVSTPIGGPVLGDITFILPNVVICVNGVLKTVDYTVTIPCV